MLIEKGLTIKCLTILDEAGRDKHGNKIWRVICSCGQEFIVQDCSIRRGQTSCLQCGRKRGRIKRITNNRRGQGVLSKHAKFYPIDDCLVDFK